MFFYFNLDYSILFANLLLNYKLIKNSHKRFKTNNYV